MELPDLYYAIFNDQLIAAIFVVVGAVKMIRNLFGDRAKGAVAVIITFAAALIYGVVQYGFTEHGIWYGIIAGLFAALSFYLSKNVNKVAGMEKNMRYEFWESLGKMAKYFLVRK